MENVKRPSAREAELERLRRELLRRIMENEERRRPVPSAAAK